MVSDSASPFPGFRNVPFYLATLLLLFFGIVIRIATFQDPVWLDELHTAWCVSESFSEVADRAIIGNQSPLYYWLVYPHYYHFFQSEMGLRFVSSQAAAITLFSLAIVAWLLTRSRAAVLVAVWLAVIDDSFIFYSIEARPYSAIQLVSLWQIFFFLRILRDSRPMPARNAILTVSAWAVVSVVLFYLHYTTLLVSALQVFIAICLVIVRPTRKRYPKQILVSWSVVGTFTLLVCMPGFIHLGFIMQSRTNWASVVDAASYWHRNMATWLIYLGLPIAVLGFSRSSSDRGVGNTRYGLAVLGACAIVVPVFAFLVTVSQIAPIAIYKFTIASSTLTLLFAAMLVGILSKKSKVWVCLIMIFLSVVTNPFLVQWLKTGSFPYQRGENWRWVYEQLSEDDRPVCVLPNLVEDAGFLTPHRQFVWDQRWADYYRFPLSGIYNINRGQRFVEGRPINRDGGYTDEFFNQLKVHGGGWLIVRGRPADGARLHEMIRRKAESEGLEFQYIELSKSPIMLFRYTQVASSDETNQ